MRSWYKIQEQFDGATGLWHVVPAPSSWHDADIPDALALVVPLKEVLLDNINWAFQFVSMDLFVPASDPSFPPVYAGSMSPHEFLFAHIFYTAAWSTAVNSPWDLR